MIKNGSSIYKFLKSPHITVLTGFHVLKLNYAFQRGQGITPPGSRLPMARSTVPGKHKTVMSANALGQMLMVTLGLWRSCGLVLSPFSLQPITKTSVCSSFINNLWSTQCSPWYSTNNSKRRHLTKEGTSITLYCLDWLRDPFACKTRTVA